MKLHQSHPQKFLTLKKKGRGGHNFSIFLAIEHAANYKLCHALWGLWEPTTGQKVPYRYLGCHTGLWVPYRTLGDLQVFRCHTGLWVTYRSLGALQDFG